MKKILLSISMAAFLVACGETEKTVEKTAEVKPAAATAQTTTTQTQTAAVAPTELEKAEVEAKEAKPVVDKAAEVENAKQVIKAFGGSLKGELVTAMKAGGPLNALDVCHTKAPEIAKQVSAEKGVNVSRVSLKNRNPNGAPNEWQKVVLEDFEARKTNGEDPAKMAHAEVVENNGKQEFRFMKAIPAGEVCLKCHGTNIAPDVQAKITSLYPDDKATGFNAGDIRGAFVIVKDL